MSASLSAHLRYLPVEIAVWIAKAQLSDSEALGDLLKACLHAWQAARTGQAPGTLPDDDAALACIIGSTSKRRLVALRQHFTPSAVAGLLVCPWLVALWEEKRAAYESASRRGRSGGRPRKGPAKSSASSARKLSQSNKEPPPEEEVPSGPPSSSGAPADGAPAVAARAAGDAPRAEHPAWAWVKAHPEQLATLERRADQHMREQWRALAPDVPRFASIRARWLEEAVIVAWRELPEQQAERQRRRELLGLVPEPVLA